MKVLVNEFKLEKDLFICKKLYTLNNHGIKEIMLICDSINYYIAAIKLKELYKLISMGRRFLIRANKFHELYLNSKDGEALQDASDMMKSCILTYNSSFDYVNQVLWFGYNLHEYDYENKDTETLLNDIWKKKGYNNVLRNCNKKNVIEVLKNKINNNASLSLALLVEGFYKNNDVRDIKKLANTLKHNANYEFEGLQDEAKWEIVSGFDATGRNIFFSDIYKSDIYKIEDVIFKIRNVHIELMKYSHKIIEFMEIIEFVNDFRKFAKKKYVLDEHKKNNTESKNKIKNKHDIVNELKNSEEKQKENREFIAEVYKIRSKHDKIHACEEEAACEKTN